MWRWLKLSEVSHHKYNLVLSHWYYNGNQAASCMYGDPLTIFIYIFYYYIVPQHLMFWLSLTEKQDGMIVAILLILFDLFGKILLCIIYLLLHIGFWSCLLF